MLKVGITGGIGSGKSTVCRVFSVLGVPVYDSDLRAKNLMATDEGLITGIVSLLGPESYRQGKLDRKYVASRVFRDMRLLNGLNSLVHPAVGRDFKEWSRLKDKEGHLYVLAESAILFESRMNELTDRVITVSAPEEVRIARVAGRDGIPEAEVRTRIERQATDHERESRSDYVINNDGLEPVLSRILELHEIFVNESRR